MSEVNKNSRVEQLDLRIASQADYPRSSRATFSYVMGLHIQHAEILEHETLKQDTR